MRTKPATDNCRHRLRERSGRIIGNLGVYDLLSLFATRTCFLAFAKRVGITLDKTMYLTRHGRKAEWGTTVPPIWLEGVPPTQELYTHTHTHTHRKPWRFPGKVMDQRYSVARSTRPKCVAFRTKIGQGRWPTARHLSEICHGNPVLTRRSRANFPAKV